MQEQFKPTVIILCGGRGKRMQSTTPKVLHQVSLQPIIQYILDLCVSLNIGSSNIHLVINEALKNNKVFQRLDNHYKFNKILQKDSLGTGDAVRTAYNKIPYLKDIVLILYGDTPFITRQTIFKMFHEIKNGSDTNIVAFHSSHPEGYGRIISTDTKRVTEIVEDKNTNTKQKQIQLCNAGIFLVRKDILSNFLNTKHSYHNHLNNEYYLTDIIKHCVQNKKKCTYIIAEENEVMGINNRQQLMYAEQYNQLNIINKLIDNSVTIISPNSSYFAYNIKIENNVIIYPNTFIGNNTYIMKNTIINSFSYLEDVHIGENVIIGPFARIRAKTKIGNNSTIGNFVELKNTTIMNNVKTKHLSYVGDATIENNVNIGAGTVFCNYDGRKKSHSYVQKNAFIGSNTSIIAPIEIGSGSIIGAGSVITKKVKANDLVLSRAKQISLKNK